MELAERFWSKIAKSDGCWNWTAYVKPNGYGQIGKGGRGSGVLLAHRVAWELTNGPIPQGLTIDHLCGNRRCVNPNHMEVVTRGVNTLRASGPSAINARKTHCDNGHSLADAYVYPTSGNRKCRECSRICQQKLRDRRKGYANGSCVQS